MSIGAGKLLSTGIDITGSYNIDLNPGAVIVLSPNGSTTSPIVYSTVNNGIGPFDYEWTITGSDITINSNTSANTSFSSGGFNQSNSETATLKVTDTGNGNLETTKDINVTFDFERGV